MVPSLSMEQVGAARIGRPTAVDCLVTVQAGAAVAKAGREGSFEHPCLVTDTVYLMTVLAEVRDLLGQKFLVSAAVGSVAVHTVFFDRRVFVEERSALVRMALVAELVGRFVTDLGFGEGAMGVMTIVTAGLVLLDRMTGGFVGIDLHIQVAAVTDLGGIRFRTVAGVDFVA